MSSESDEIEEKNYKDPALYYMNYEFEIGDIDNYIVEAKIGRGRYSDVYEGIQKKLNEKVVLKILKPITKVKIKRGRGVKNNMNKNLSFACDYLEGAHPKVLEKLLETNMEQTVGYGLDEYSATAKEKIRKACGAPDADIYFLVGGTQTNATMIDSMLKSYEAVLAATTGHICDHEAGAIEFCGHKVITLKQFDGKINSSDIENYMKSYLADKNKDHLVMPGMVYLSQPTEYGTLYSLKELEDISSICKKHNLKLYVDGARLAYALGAKENDVTLKDLARLCDVFYIGGTKCGALSGEAVVIPKHDIPHIFTIIKQHGALLAKGRIAGIQFDVLFTDELYMKIGREAVELANMIKEALHNKNYEFAVNSPTNQIFLKLTDEQIEKFKNKIDLGFWEQLDDGKKVMRIVTSFATTRESVERLISLL